MAHQIDVNVNMTFELSNEEWDEWQTEWDEDPITTDGKVMEITRSHLDGEELVCCGAARAWICSIDSATYMQEVK